jgi:hypothetical protein
VRYSAKQCRGYRGVQYSAEGLRECSIVQGVYGVQYSSKGLRECSIVQGVYVSAV